MCDTTAIPGVTTPTRTESRSRPSTSSSTAAPRITEASRVDSARSSDKTDAVTPMLVAVSVAPTNTADSWPYPQARASPQPNRNGITMPANAVIVAGFQTLRNFER